MREQRGMGFAGLISFIIPWRVYDFGVSIDWLIDNCRIDTVESNLFYYLEP